jgi:CAF1 family ribonuclease
MFDTPQQRYSVVRESARNFHVPQVGVCTFQWNEDGSVLHAKPFSFYGTLSVCISIYPSTIVKLHNSSSSSSSTATATNLSYPRPPDSSFCLLFCQTYSFSSFLFLQALPADRGRRGDTNFLCQVGSLHFLAKHKFDFNKLFQHGAPYLRREEELRARQDMAAKLERMDSNRDSRAIPSRQRDVEFLRRARDDLEAWLEGKIPEQKQPLADGQPENSKSQLCIRPYNGFQRLLFYQMIGDEFDGVAATKVANPRHEVSSLWVFGFCVYMYIYIYMCVCVCS